MIQAIIEIINESKKSFLESPLKEALKICGSRLTIFLAVVFANFILFGLVLAIKRFSTRFSSITTQEKITIPVPPFDITLTQPKIRQIYCSSSP